MKLFELGENERVVCLSHIDGTCEAEVIRHITQTTVQCAEQKALRNAERDAQIAKLRELQSADIDAQVAAIEAAKEV